jgi:hypothetical protein
MPEDRFLENPYESMPSEETKNVADLVVDVATNLASITAETLAAPIVSLVVSEDALRKFQEPMSAKLSESRFFRSASSESPDQVKESEKV